MALIKHLMEKETLRFGMVGTVYATERYYDHDDYNYETVVGESETVEAPLYDGVEVVLEEVPRMQPMSADKMYPGLIVEDGLANETIVVRLRAERRIRIQRGEEIYTEPFSWNECRVEYLDSKARRRQNRRNGPCGSVR